MNSTKKKIEATPEQVEKKIASESEEPVNEELKALRDIWADSIQELKQGNFKNQEEAVEALISQVLTRMRVPDGESQNIRIFLRYSLETDPEIMEELSQALKL